MKARWTTALALGLCCSAPAAASALDSACDVDLDGAVTPADAQMVADAADGGCPTCDLNHDGAVTEVDTEVVAKHLLGIEACPVTGEAAADFLWASQGTKALVYVQDASGMTMYFVTTIAAPGGKLLPPGEAVSIDTTGDGRADKSHPAPLAMRPPVTVSMPGQPPALILTFTHSGFLRWRKAVGTASAPPALGVDLDGDGLGDAALKTVGAYGW